MTPIFSKNCLMRSALLALSLGLVSSIASAADIFVRDASGTDMSKDQRSQVTDMVKQSIRQMPEHTLVMSEERADFVLQPSVVHKGDDAFLRIEKRKDGDLLSQSEERIDLMNPSSDRAMAATESAMRNDQIASGSRNFMDNSSTSSTTPDSDDMRAMHSNDMNRHPLLGHDDSISGTTSDSVTASDLASGSQVERNSANSDRSSSISGSTASAADSSAPAVAGGDVRAPSPVFQQASRGGTFEIGVGPAFGLGMNSDQILYDINLGYNMMINEMFSAKAFGDLNLASGADANRFLNFGLGGDFYPLQTANMIGNARPYITADVGYAFTRDKQDRTADAPAIGAGAGFKFAANQLNMDVNLHYTMLTTKIRDDVPSVLGIRAALNF